jgi:hypothetical protein
MEWFPPVTLMLVVLVPIVFNAPMFREPPVKFIADAPLIVPKVLVPPSTLIVPMLEMLVPVELPPPENVAIAVAPVPVRFVKLVDPVPETFKLLTPLIAPRFRVPP